VAGKTHKYRRTQTLQISFHGCEVQPRSWLLFVENKLDFFLKKETYYTP
jgi:hypothetical protein